MLALLIQLNKIVSYKFSFSKTRVLFYCVLYYFLFFIKRIFYYVLLLIYLKHTSLPPCSVYKEAVSSTINLEIIANNNRISNKKAGKNTPELLRGNPRTGRKTMNLH